MDKKTNSHSIKINEIIEMGIAFKIKDGSFIKLEALTSACVIPGNFVPEDEYISVKTGITKRSIIMTTIMVKVKIAIG